MARTIHANATTEIDADANRFAILLFMDIKEGALRFWTGYGDITYDSNTYTGSGDFIRLGEIEEASDIRAVKLPIFITGIPSATVSKVFNHTWRRRAAKVWLSFFDTSWAIVSDPILLFSGRMGNVEILREVETSTIQVDIESKMVDLNRTNERRYTHEDQINRFPDDKFFDRISENVNREIPWGRKGSPVNSTTNPIAPPIVSDEFP